MRDMASQTKGVDVGTQAPGAACTKGVRVGIPDDKPCAAERFAHALRLSGPFGPT